MSQDEEVKGGKQARMQMQLGTWRGSGHGGSSVLRGGEPYWSWRACGVLERGEPEQGKRQGWKGQFPEQS